MVHEVPDLEHEPAFLDLYRIRVSLSRQLTFRGQLDWSDEMSSRRSREVDWGKATCGISIFSEGAANATAGKRRKPIGCNTYAMTR